MEAIQKTDMLEPREWKRGDKTALALAVGISRQHLNEVLMRRTRINQRAMADMLEHEAFNLGYCIPWDAWMLSSETDNPFFAEKGETHDRN